MIQPASIRGVLSTWTRTPMFRLDRGQLLIQTLAVSLANRAFAETHFVTDTAGRRIATALGWSFDHISTALEDFAAEGLEHIWALGKLVACSIQDEPFVQFDGDVLLFKPLPEQFLGARLFAQSTEPEAFYTSPEMRRGFAICGLPEGHPKYNAGLLGGRDVALVRAYAHASLELAQRFRGCDLNGTTTSMIVEQAHLGVFAARCGVEVGTLLPEQPSSAQIREAGYAHLIGEAKRNPYYVARSERRLEREFPEDHERFSLGWMELAGAHQPSSASALAACL